ncbi:hypothetical protein BGZ46_006796 [Entomortierella lignicola]|nr:hypothetical protein BGZ46_006796 [Entomortierella lignicola]
MKLSTSISVAIAMLASLSVNALPTQTSSSPDPCSDLAAQGQNPNSMLNFETVRDCFYSFPYNKELVEKTIDSLYNVIDKFYIFKDLAKAPTRPPFSTPRVDLLAGLKKIRAKKWDRDIDFRTAIRLLFNSVNDGHLGFYDNCYGTVLFLQPISLYAPVENGRQSARVLYVDPLAGALNSTIDCTVTHIDGAPALEVIQEYADTDTGRSKDPGVRLNVALGSYNWAGNWALFNGAFSMRISIPKNAAVEYEIQCGKSASQKFTVPWIAVPYSTFPYNGFNDTQSYWSNACVTGDKPVNRLNQQLKNNVGHQGGRSLTPHALPVRKSLNLAKDISANPPLQFKYATVTFTSTLTTFYKLNGSNGCAVVIANEDATYPDDYNAFIDGLLSLRDAGCKKLVFHMTNNGGGSIDFGYFINAVLFPDSKPYTSYDMRDGPYIRGLGKLATSGAPIGVPPDTKRYNSSQIVLFDARRYNSTLTGQAYIDDTLFTHDTLYRRGGTTDAYTQRLYLDYNWSMFPLSKNQTLPWKASDMAIYTNGGCASACTLFSIPFNALHGVKTYAIGGIHKRPLSFVTYPGGFGSETSNLVQKVQEFGYDATGGPTNMPIQALAYFPMSESYLDDASVIPLEFDSKFFTAQSHLDYDSVTVRQPDVIWVKIVEELNKKH